MSLQTLGTEHTGATRHRERRDDEVTDPHRPHVRTDRFDDTDELVPHRRARRVDTHGVVGMQVTATDAGPHDPYESVGGRLDGVIRDIDDADIARSEHVRRFHAFQSTSIRVVRGVTDVPGTASTSHTQRLLPTVDS